MKLFNKELNTVYDVKLVVSNAGLNVYARSTETGEEEFSDFYPTLAEFNTEWGDVA